MQEPAIDPAQVVDVEKVTIRYEADHVWLITDRVREDGYLSCCLNVTWPDPDLGPSPRATIPNAEPILKAAWTRSFGGPQQCGRRPISARSSVVDGRFAGWLSFTNDQRANAAFETLRELLHGAGLVVKQWSRDMIIPRQWR